MRDFYHAFSCKRCGARGVLHERREPGEVRTIPGTTVLVLESYERVGDCGNVSIVLRSDGTLVRWGTDTVGEVIL